MKANRLSWLSLFSQARQCIRATMMSQLVQRIDKMFQKDGGNGNLQNYYQQIVVDMEWTYLNNVYGV